jgi:hypothetical protein
LVHAFGSFPDPSFIGTYLYFVPDTYRNAREGP